MSLEQNARLAITPLVRMTGIGKRFGRVPVLQEVEFEVLPGEVHILAGENGAGKSTLIKILGGVHTDFDGTIEIEGRAVRPGSPLAAGALGVAVIFQELSLVPSMTVADNIFLGHFEVHAGFVRDRDQRRAARRMLDRLGIEVDIKSRIEELPVAQQQLVEIAKALARNARTVVMDEPTSALSAPEVERLFILIRELKGHGRAVIYITHRMEEIQRIGDRITVLRDGRRIGTAPVADLAPSRIVEWMVGGPGEEIGTAQAAQDGRERLRLDHFTVPGRPGRRPLVDNVSLSVHRGEILGLAGLHGSGTSELFLALFGALGKRVRGSAELDGRPLRISSPRHAINQGIALLTNDRKATGLILPLSIVANATLAALPRLSPAGWRRSALEQSATDRLARRLDLRAASLGLEVGALSGGNQQKVALAKWLQTQPRLLLLDEPTRGIDIGAKREIYRLLGELAGEGIAVVLITSELPELLALSDRIVVMHRGRISAEFTREQATVARVLEAAMSGRRYDS